MDALPNELVLAIALDLDLFTLLQLSSSNRRFSRLIRSPDFGSRYLTHHAASTLHFFVDVSIPISQMDVFYFGYRLHESRDESLALLAAGPYGFIHGIQRISGTYFQYCFKPTITGRMVWQFDDRRSPASDPSSLQLHRPLFCNLPGQNSEVWAAGEATASYPSGHSKLCPFCQAFSVTNMVGTIDKRFRVFLQTWEDSIEYSGFSNGIPVTIRIHHEGGPDDLELWNAGDSHTVEDRLDDIHPRSNIRVYAERYGLRWSAEMARGLEAIFRWADIPGSSQSNSQGNSQSNLQGSRTTRNRPKLYNPWA